MTVQNLAQLKNRYPDEQWAEILGNMDTQLMLGCTDEVTAEFFSVRSGDMTVEVNSTMTVRKTLAVAQMIPQYRHTEGKGRRRLLTPDEVLRLPNDELLIIIRGQKVLKANKFDYTSHPYAKLIEKKPISEYTPRRQRPPTPLPQTEPKPEPTGTRPPGKKLYGAARPPDEF
jgi:type IV secretion system protein VirD4